MQEEVKETVVENQEEVSTDQAENKEIEETTKENVVEETETEVEEESAEEEEVSNETEIDEEERKRRAYYAEKKRQAKAAKQQELEIVEAKIGNVNPFTGLKIEDDGDKQEYEEMLLAKEKGYNPKDVTQMSKFRKEQRMTNRISELEKQAQEFKAQEEERIFIQEDKLKFKEAYPEVDLADLVNNNDKFASFAKGRVGKEPLADIYKDFLEQAEQYKAEAENDKYEALARVKSSPGKLGQIDIPESRKPMTAEALDKWMTDAKAGRIK